MEPTYIPVFPLMTIISSSFKTLAIPLLVIEPTDIVPSITTLPTTLFKTYIALPNDSYIIISVTYTPKALQLSLSAYKP